MQRLQRLFHIHIHIEHCGVCGGTLRVIACIETTELIEKILTYLAARNTDGIDCSRAPPLGGIRVRITSGSTKKQGLEVGHDL